MCGSRRQVAGHGYYCTAVKTQRVLHEEDISVKVHVDLKLISLVNEDDSVFNVSNRAGERTNKVIYQPGTSPTIFDLFSVFSRHMTCTSEKKNQCSRPEKT